MRDQQKHRSAYTYAQCGQSLCLSLDYSMSVKLLTEHHLEFLSLKGGCTDSPESTFVKIPHCCKSHVATQINMHLLVWPLTQIKHLLLAFYTESHFDNG